MSDKKYLKILIVWGESLAKQSGGTVHCIGLARGLVNLGHDIRVITPLYKRQTLGDTGFNITPVKLPPKSGAAFAIFQFMTIFCLPWWIIKYKPDIIYVRTCFFQWLMALICRIMGRPLVGEIDSLVDSEIIIRGRSKLLAWSVRSLDKINSLFSSGLVCVSEGLRREFINNRWAREDTTVAIHNGAMIDIMKPYDMQEMRRKFNLPAEPVIFAFAGTFAPWQGLDFLVEAVSILKRQDVGGVKFAMMGGGILKDDLNKWIKARGIEDYFLFESPGDHQKVAMFLSACDAAVIPINDKRKIGVCSPLKFFDAVSVGLPVIISHGSELDDVLSTLGVPGMFDPDSAQSLADILISTAENIEKHRPRRHEIHQIVCEKYSWNNVAQQTVELFERLLRK